MMSFFLLLFLSFHQALHAYTDPGTGAMIWQLLMAAGVGLLFYAKSFVNRIKSLFNKKETKSSQK